MTLSIEELKILKFSLKVSPFDFIMQNIYEHMRRAPRVRTKTEISSNDDILPQVPILAKTVGIAGMTDQTVAIID